MFIRTLAAVICSLALLFTVSGCGSSCSTACSKIYGECKFTIDTLSEEDCVKLCDDADNDEEKDDAIDCVMQASCNESVMESCIFN